MACMGRGHSPWTRDRDRRYPRNTGSCGEAVSDDDKCPRCKALHPTGDHLSHCAAVADVERAAPAIAGNATALIPARPVTAWQVTDAICRIAQHAGASPIAATAALEVLIDAGWRP